MNDNFEGKGSLIYSERGGKYEGEFLNGVRHGKGKMIYEDGSWYEGQWNMDLRNGQGMFTYTNGNSYSGQWTLDKEDGIGFYRYEQTGKIEMRTYIMGQVKLN